MLTRNEILFVRSLTDRAAREREGLFVVEGDKMVGELLQSEMKVERVFTTSKSRIKHSVAEVVSEKEMERMSSLKNPSDSLALVRLPDREFEIGSGELVIALDRVQDPGNLGTIVRMADWFGVRNIIASVDTVDCFNRKVVQSTMGALFRVKVHYGNLPQMLAELRRGGRKIYGTMLEGGESLYDKELDNNAVLVMGSEGQGISREVAEQLTERLFIPPYPVDGCACESLNVAVATAVACAEFRRQAGERDKN